MILQTKSNVIDNTGVKKVKIIKVFNKKKAYLGDIVLVSIKHFKIKKKIIKDIIYKALVLNTKKSIIRKDGFCISCKKNNVVLLHRDNSLLNNIIKSFFTKETFLKCFKNTFFKKMFLNIKIIL